MMLRSIRVGVAVVLLAATCHGQPAEAWGSDVSVRALAVLRAGLSSAAFWPAMHAAEGLTIAGYGAEVRAALRPRLRLEADDQRRCGLARELVRAGDAASSRVMLGILAGSDPHGHVHAAESLFKVGWTGEHEALVTAFGQSQNPPILRLMVAAALAKYGEENERARSLAFLRATLSETADVSLFRLAAWILARVGDAADIPRIQSRLQDATDPRVRAFLDHALARLGDPVGRAALSRNLESSDAVIRTYAAIFAGEAGMLEVAPQLVVLLDDPEQDTRIRAAQAWFTLRQFYENTDHET